MSDTQLIQEYLDQGGTITISTQAKAVYKPHRNPVPIPTNKVVHTGPAHAFSSLYSLDETTHNYGR